MRSLLLIAGTICCFLMACSYSPQRPIPRENGWYYVLGENQDSLSREPIVTVKEFAELRLDSDSFGIYAIVGVVSKHKLQKWADATEQAIGKHIAFVFNDSSGKYSQKNVMCPLGVRFFEVSPLENVFVALSGTSFEILL